MESTKQEAYRNARISLLAAIAYVTVILCLVVTVWFIDEMNQYAQGIVTLVLGRFLGYTDQVMAFDFNTTRSSGVKDETIAKLSAVAPVAGTVTTTTEIQPTKEDV